MPRTVDRVGPNDLMQMALDVGPSPMHIGAILVLDRAVDPDAVITSIGARLVAVPRMRQRLVRVPLGCGGPIWVDDAEFAARRHVDTISAGRGGGERTLLEEAVRWYARPLPTDRPLWRATVISDLPGGRAAVVLAVHHVLADGIGGLALLAGLVDGAPEPAPAQPRPMPRRRALVADAWGTRLRALAEVPRSLRALRPARRELGGATRATPCSLNQPLSPQLRVAVVRTDLGRLRESARSQGATVNDAALAAVTRAVGELLARRGEEIDQLVVSVPVTGGATDRTENRVGVMPVTVPLDADLAQIAALTRARKGAARGQSTTLTRPVFRLLGTLGVLRWLFRRQRMVNTFLTNVRGPERTLTFVGAEVIDLVPLGIVSGNVTVAFTLLTYAGTLTIAVAADPVACRDLDVLVELLQQELDRV